MQKWEYMEVQLTQGNWEDSTGAKGTYRGQPTFLNRLCALGDEGWEMTGIIPGISNLSFFKRPRP